MPPEKIQSSTEKGSKTQLGGILSFNGQVEDGPLKRWKKINQMAKEENQKISYYVYQEKSACEKEENC